MRPQSGPAMTRVRSSTRTPLSGMRSSEASDSGSGSGGEPSSWRTIVSSGRVASAWPCGCACHSSRLRSMKAQERAAITASSRSKAFQPAQARAMSSRFSSAPRSSSVRPRKCGKLQCRWM